MHANRRTAEDMPMVPDLTPLAGDFLRYALMFWPLERVEGCAADPHTCLGVRLTIWTDLVYKYYVVRDKD